MRTSWCSGHLEGLQVHENRTMLRGNPRACRSQLYRTAGMADVVWPRMPSMHDPLLLDCFAGSSAPVGPMVREPAAEDVTSPARPRPRSAYLQRHRVGRMIQPTDPTDPTARQGPDPQRARPHAGGRPALRVGTGAPQQADCGRGRTAARRHDPADAQPTATDTRTRGCGRGPVLSCGRPAALAVELEITWLGGDADAGDANGAAALRAAQGRVLRAVLAAITAQRAATPVDTPSRRASGR